MMMDKLSLIPRLAITLPFIYICGLFHLIAYYNEFGFRYSELSLEYYHVFYQGMILLYTNLLGSFLLLIVFLCSVLTTTSYQIWIFGAYHKLSWVSEIGVSVAFVAVWPVAAIDGYYSVQRDSVPSTTQLRRLVTLQDSTGMNLHVFDDLTKSADRLGRASIFIFRKTPSELSVIVPLIAAQVGAVQVAVHTIKLRPGDYYVETPSGNYGSIPFRCPFC